MKVKRVRAGNPKTKLLEKLAVRPIDQDQIADDPRFSDACARHAKHLAESEKAHRTRNKNSIAKAFFRLAVRDIEMETTRHPVWQGWASRVFDGIGVPKAERRFDIASDQKAVHYGKHLIVLAAYRMAVAVAEMSSIACARFYATNFGLT